MGMREGAYTIAQITNGHCLELHRGRWHLGQVIASSTDDLDHDTQQWFLAHPPGAELDVYVLFNLSIGVYAGVWQSDWAGIRNRVKCSPSRASALNIQWRVAVANDQSPLTIRWLGDEAKLLSSSKPGNEIFIERGKEDEASIRWRFDSIEPDADAWRDWMDQLPDDIALDAINLPSTHQSLAFHGIDMIRPDLDWLQPREGFVSSLLSRLPCMGRFVKTTGYRPWVPLPTYVDNPRCQDASLWAQLNMGIRSFDIRLDIDRLPMLQRQSPRSPAQASTEYFLYARHGLGEIGYAWSAVLLTLKVFLQHHPSEFVLLNIRYEKSRPAARDRFEDWQRTFVEETSPFWQDDEGSIIYRWWEHDAPNMTDLTLADVRGKVVCTTHGNYMPWDKRDGRHRGCRFMPHKMHAVGKYDTPRSQWDTQLQNCEANLAAAKACPLGDRTYFQTSLNVSGLPDPLKLNTAVQHAMHLNQTRDASRDKIFDPKDFWEYLRVTWTARGEKCPFSEESLGKNGQFRIGKVDMDFVESVRDWVAAIVRSNRTKSGREF